MIYPENFEQKIGFDKIRELITKHCLSPLGVNRVETTAFLTDYKAITLLLDLTTEAVRIIQEEENFPANFFYDVRETLKRIRIAGTYIDVQEAFDIKRSLETIRDIVRFFSKEECPYPTFVEFSRPTPIFPQTISQIDRIVDKLGHIKDNASPALAEIRRELAKTTASISKILHSILRRAQSEGLVEKDTSAAIRDGRLVIPISPMHKRKLKGIVHDESATGKTVYIEPQEVVEANNRIRELENEERKEIIKILTILTDEIRPFAPSMLESYNYLADVDFTLAKAKLSIKLNAQRPTLEDKCIIDWANAIHPLLFLSLEKQGKKVVPLDITLTTNNRILIISGPNAGGKSVCLKTVGLLQYMIQCGILIPLHENSKVGIFKDILIDIGDEQSIENDLSTYSSHLTNMKQFVRHANKRSLLLIDEFGAGTEPLIGGAIAEALLQQFNEFKAMGIITTHYQNLKHYAEEHDGVINGAMLYDRHEMQPLFKLSIGNPGSSFAIEIARKIGLPEVVINQASAIVGQDYVNMDKYLQDIVRDKRYWETKRQNIRSQEKKLEEMNERYDKQFVEINQLRKEIISQAKQEAQQLIASSNAKIENTIRVIKETQAEKSITRTIRKELEEFKQTIDRTEEESRIARKIEKLTHKKKKEKRSEPLRKEKTTTARPILVGDNVKIKGQSNIGRVMEINNDSAVIAFGMIKSTVKVVRLEHSVAPAVQQQKSSSFVSSQTFDSMYEKKLQFKQEIDIRGQRADEALQAVIYFIDDAIQVGVDKVRILHGTGTGALRDLTRNYLRTIGGIRDFHDEHVQFGGSGITVIEFE